MKHLLRIAAGLFLIIWGIGVLNFGIHKYLEGQVIFAWLPTILMGAGSVVGGILVLWGAKIRNIFQRIF